MRRSSSRSSAGCNPLGILLAGLLMSLLYLGGDSAQMTLGLPSSVAGLFQGTMLFLLLAIDVFIHYRLRAAPASRRRRSRRAGHRGGRHMIDMVAGILVATLVAGTPLVYAALGELVTERSGVLNLGVEGMMLCGAVSAFVGRRRSPATSGSASAPAMLAGAVLRLPVRRAGHQLQGQPGRGRPGARDLRHRA